jgi:hypothetical protein
MRVKLAGTIEPSLYASRHSTALPAKPTSANADIKAVLKLTPQRLKRLIFQQKRATHRQLYAY